MKEEIPIPDPERKGLLLNWISGEYDRQWLCTQGSVTNIGRVPLEDVIIKISHYDLEGNWVRTDNVTLSPNKIGIGENAKFYLRILQRSEGGTFRWRFLLPSGEVIFSRNKDH